MNTLSNFLTVGFLVTLEILLSWDNVIVLSALVSHLPKEQQKKALTYGIAGAFGFRFLALTFITYLLRSVWVKFVGGAYLLFIAFKMLKGGEDDEAVPLNSSHFWKMVVWVELTDITFSMDSIVASVGVSSKFYVVLTGGILGIIAMRFVASFFINLIAKFPNLQTSAAMLVFIVGAKMWLQALGVSYNEAVIWITMGVCFAMGFIPPKKEIKT